MILCDVPPHRELEATQGSVQTLFSGTVPNCSCLPHATLATSGHCSFGGVVLLKLMEELASEGGREEEKEKVEDDAGGTGLRAAMAGGAFLCSVPPSGNGPMTKRFIKQVSGTFVTPIWYI